MEKQKFAYDGKPVDIKKGKTQNATDRDNMIKYVFGMLSKDSRTRNKTIEKVFRGERGVTVDGVYILTQGNSGPGVFEREFSETPLPLRSHQRSQ